MLLSECERFRRVPFSVNTPRLASLLLAASLLLLAAAQFACSPLRFEVTLGPERALSESRVAGDAHGPKVALIDLRGLIAPPAAASVLSGTTNTLDAVTRRLRLAEDDRNVRAVVLRIDSPGGSVTASDQIYREVRSFSERSGKPVVALLSTIATSGGYYVALAGDAIVAEPTGITGSIGVIIPGVNAAEGLARIGVRSSSVASGPNKELANPLAPETDAHRAILQDLVDNMHERFVDLVRERRAGIDPAALPELTDGRVVSGAHAASVGLADETGGIDAAFRRAKDLAGLSIARLVIYHASGSRPATPYAIAETGTPAPLSIQGARIDLLGGLSGNAGYELRRGVPYYVYVTGLPTLER